MPVVPALGKQRGMSQRVTGQSNLTETVSSKLVSKIKWKVILEKISCCQPLTSTHTHACTHTYKDYTQHTEEKKKS